MKFIGQFIQSLVSRFRNDVFLENISSGTIASGGNLGLDSNNKIVKANEATGDITRVQFTADTTEVIQQNSGNADFTISGGNAIGTDINDSTGAIEINHDDTSSQASVNNSGRTYIQDITLDTYGHVTGLTSATETVTNTDTNTVYNLSAVDGSSSDSEIIRLEGDDETIDDVTLAAGTGLSISRTSNKITFTNTVSDTNTQLSNAEVRAAVEAATDSNVFTDADHTKLNGIEASATADQTASEIRTLLGTGNGNLVPAAGSAGEFLKHDGTFGTPSYTTNTNQLTEFTLTGDSGSNQTIAHGNTLDIAGGNAISTVVSATDTVTINHDDTSSQASVNNSGRTYIQDIVLDTYGHVTGLTSATETVTDTNTQLTQEQVLEFAGSASESGVGLVELATQGEARAGTDTSRAVTSAGLKAHVDARFSYQYISFTGNADISTNWAVPGTNGPFTHNYNTDTGTNGSSVGSTSFNAARAKQNGFVVPYDNAVLCGFYGMMRNNTANNQGALGLFHSTYATFGARTATSTFTLQAYALGDQTGGSGSSYQGFTKVVDLSRSLDLTAGDIIMPAILQANEKAYAQFTIVIKTPLL